MQAGGLVYCDVHQKSALDATSWSAPLSHVNNGNTLKRLCEITFPSNNTRLPKEHCFCNVPRLRPFVLLVRVNKVQRSGALVEWHWQRKTEVLGGKPVPVPLCPQISRGLNPGPTTNRMSHGTAFLKAKITLHYIRRPSPYRAVNAIRLGYTNQSVNAV
jgi:hypothetical protein